LYKNNLFLYFSKKKIFFLSILLHILFLLPLSSDTFALAIWKGRTAIKRINHSDKKFVRFKQLLYSQTNHFLYLPVVTEKFVWRYHVCSIRERSREFPALRLSQFRAPVYICVASDRIWYHRKGAFAGSTNHWREW